jgi:hypothetical protein
MKYRPDARLRPPLIGFKMVKAVIIKARHIVRTLKYKYS